VNPTKTGRILLFFLLLSLLVGFGRIWIQNGFSTEKMFENYYSRNRISNEQYFKGYGEEETESYEAGEEGRL